MVFSVKKSAYFGVILGTIAASLPLVTPEASATDIQPESLTHMYCPTGAELISPTDPNGDFVCEVRFQYPQGPQTWTVPEGVTSIDLLVGGGGGGGGIGGLGPDSWAPFGNSMSVQRYYAGGGGGAGEVEAHLNYTVTPNQTFNLEVGRGGNRGSMLPVDPSDPADTLAEAIAGTTPATAGVDTTWNDSEFTAKGGGAGGTVGFPLDEGWSGGGGAGVGSPNSAADGTAGTVSGHEGGDGTTAALSCADLGDFYYWYGAWADTCPYAGGESALVGKSSNLTFVAGGGGGGNGGPGTSGTLGTEPDIANCDTAYPTVIGGNGGGAAAVPGGLFAIGRSTDPWFGAFDGLGAGGGGAVVSPNIGYVVNGEDCVTRGIGIADGWDNGAAVQASPSTDDLGWVRIVQSAYNVSPASGGAGGLIYTADSNVFGDGGALSGGDGFVVIRFAAFLGYGSGANVLNEGGAQTATDGIEIPVGGGQMQVYRYNPPYQEIGAGGCTPDSCVLETNPAAPHQAQFYSGNPPEDPNLDETPNIDLSNGWYVAVVDKTGTTEAVVGPVVPNDEFTPDPPILGWESVTTTGGSLASDQVTGATNSITSDLTYQGITLHVTVSYTGQEQEANIQLSLDTLDDGNTYRVYHYLDTYLLGGDQGPGFYDDSDPTHPMVGVRKTLLDGSGVMIALRNNAKAWSGYASKHYECSTNGWSSEWGAPCSTSALSQATEAVFKGGLLWTGPAAIQTDPSTDNGLAAAWELPSDGTTTTGAIDYDLVFQTFAAPNSGAVYIDGRDYNSAPQSCTNTPFTSLYDALDTGRLTVPAGHEPAETGDTVYVCPGAHLETFNSVAASGVTIVGLDAAGEPAEGDDRPVITKVYEEDLVGPLVSVEGDITIRNLIIDGAVGYLDASVGGTDGGAIAALGNVSVFDSAINNSMARNGGAINSGGNVWVERSTFSGNTAIGGQSRGGAIYTLDGLVTVIDSTFEGNHAAGSGSEGGAIAADRTDARDSGFLFNGAENGGAIWNEGSTSAGSWTTNVSGGAFEHNEGSYGAGAIDTDKATIIGASFTGNIGYQGGAVFGEEWVDVTNSTFIGNKVYGGSGSGGAVAVFGSVRYPGVGPIAPQGSVLGAGPLTSGPRLNVWGSTFTDNYGSFGGALGTVNEPPMYVENSVFTTNHGADVNSGFDGQGGAIYSTGLVEVVSSTFDRNDTDSGDGDDTGAGGAIYAMQWTSPTFAAIIANATFAGNSSGTGGALDVSTAKVSYSTFSGNVAGNAGAVNLFKSFEVANSAFVGNATSGASCVYTGGFTGIVDLGGNVADDDDCAPDAAIKSSAEMNLGSLADNGGPVPTVAFDLPSWLEGGAVCATASDVTIDQRGVSRGRGTGCDAGAYEYLHPSNGPGQVYIVGRYYDGSSDHDSTDSNFGAATACDNTPWQTIGDAVLAATDGDTVHVCGLTDSGSRIGYEEPMINVYANDITIEGDDWDASLDEPLPTLIAGPITFPHGLFNVAPSVTKFSLDQIALENGNNTNGGSVYAPNALVVITNSNIGFSMAAERGGAIYARSVSVASTSEFLADGLNTFFQATTSGDFSGDLAGPADPNSGGGAIYATDSATIDHAAFAYSSTAGNGGAVLARDLVITDSMFAISSARSGGIAASTEDGGSVFITGSSFLLGGLASGSGYGSMLPACPFCSPGYGSEYGGAVAVTGANSTVVIDSSSFSLNEAHMLGGAVYAAGASLSVTNSSFIENFTSGESGGAAIGAAAGTVVQLQHLSFLSNIGYGSSVAILKAYAPDTPAADSWVANSIFADSLELGSYTTDTTCFDPDGVLADGGGNLTSDDDCPGQLATADELGLQTLPPFAVMGGSSPNLLPTGRSLGGAPSFDLVIVPSAGSIAYDFIEPVAGACDVDVDQTGTSRPQIDGCDAGAYELKPVGGALYVEQNNTVGGGSCASPDFNTVTAAVAAASAGDTIHVCTGVYREPLVVPSVADLTIEGDGVTQTIFDGEAVPGDPTSRGPLLDATGAANLSISGITFRNGHGANGGAIDAGSNAVNLTDVRFEDNEADGNGGALVVGATSTLDGVQFTGNTAGGNGGAIAADADLTILNSSFGDNTASSGDGGAIYAGGRSLTVKNSTFAHVSAPQGRGGAIFATNILVVFVTTYDASAGVDGAAYYADDFGRLELTASLTLNTQTDSGTGYACGVGGDVSIVDSGANITTDGTCYSVLDPSSSENADDTTIIDQTVDDPYDWWGGATKTVKLSDGGGDTSLNPAIDFAPCSLDSSVTVDQRGIVRPQQEQCDSGAFEYVTPTPAVYIVGRTWDGSTEDPSSPDAAPASCTNTPYSTVLGAVQASIDDDIVHVCAGEYFEYDINWEHQRLTIEGEGASATIIDADSNERVLNFPGDEITLRSLTLRGGLTGDNGGAIVAASVTASDVVFDYNTATNGGAIYVEDNVDEGVVAFVSVIDCDFTANGDSGTLYGGAIYAHNNGTVRIDGSWFFDNQVDGAALVTGASALRPMNFPIEAKDAAIEGSGGAVLAGTIDVMDSYFESNLAATHGGALLASTVTVKYSQFEDNHADGFDVYDGYGGAIWAFIADVEGSTFTNNSATAAGAIGAVAETSPDSVGPKGLATGTITVNSSTFDGNTATYGAGVYAFSGEVISTNSTYHANAASMGGGAIQSVGNMTLTENTFAENTAGDLSVGGGTLLTGAEVTATDNIFKYASGEFYGYNGCQFDWTNFDTKIHDNGGNLSSDDWCIGRAWTADDEFDLHELDDNGGPTQTMRLGVDSIARDYIPVGSGCATNVDQRGTSRPQFTDCDAGAYEYNLLMPTVTVSLTESAIDSGASDDISATVTYAAGTPAPLTVSTPTGQVQFYYCVPADLTAPATCADQANWTAIGSPADLDDTATAYYPEWTPPADGTYEVHAIYLGDDNFEIADTTVTGSATVVVGVNLSTIKVCVHRTSVTYGKQLPDLDVDYCVPIGECFPAPTGVGPTSHNDACCPSTAPTKFDGIVTILDDKCCPVSPDTVVPMDPGHCLRESTDGFDDEEGSDVSTVEPDLVYSEVGQSWVAQTPTADGPSAPETSSPEVAGGKDELPDGYYEVEPKKVYEWYGVVPPTCTVPGYEVGTPVADSPLDIECEGGDPGTGYQFDFSLVDEQEFTVLPAQLKLKPDSLHVTFGDPVPTYTYKVRGFKLGESPDTASGWVDAVCTSDYDSSSPAGSRFPITCSGAGADNYVFKFEAGHLEVRKARLRVAPTSMVIDYGSAVPSVFAWSLSGYKAAEAPAAAEMLAGFIAPTCASAYSKGSKAGTYDITCSGGDAKNYEFDTATTATLTVRKLGLKVVPKSAMVPYGTSKPSLGFSFTGLVNGESEPGLGYQAPVCSAAAYTSATPAGTVLSASCTGGSASNYTFDTAATASLTVVKAPLKVVPASPTVVYGSTLTAPAASISGFVNGQSASTAAGYVAPVCTVSYSVTTPAGSYPLSCSGGAATNYAFDTSSVGLLTVSKAPITITPTSASVVYGAVAPVVRFTLAGFKNSQTAAAFTSQPTCSSAYVQGSGVGSYPVNCSGGAAANYSFVTAPAAVTVSPAPLVVQPDPKVITYGDAVPVFSSSISGFVLGQSTAAAGLVAPTCGSAFTPAKAAGSYAITCSGASLANYSFTYRTSTLTVAKAVLTVTPASKTITKGSAIPTYTYTVTGHKYGQTTTTTAGYTAPKCTSRYTRTSVVGTYTISCSSGVATNYTFQYTTAILRVI